MNSLFPDIIWYESNDARPQPEGVAHLMCVVEVKPTVDIGEDRVVDVVEDVVEFSAPWVSIGILVAV